MLRRRRRGSPAAGSAPDASAALAPAAGAGLSSGDGFFSTTETPDWPEPHAPAGGGGACTARAQSLGGRRTGRVGGSPAGHTANLSHPSTAAAVLTPRWLGRRGALGLGLLCGLVCWCRLGGRRTILGRPAIAAARARGTEKKNRRLSLSGQRRWRAPSASTQPPCAVDGGVREREREPRPTHGLLGCAPLPPLGLGPLPPPLPPPGAAGPCCCCVLGACCCCDPDCGLTAGPFDAGPPPLAGWGGITRPNPLYTTRCILWGPRFVVSCGEGLVGVGSAGHRALRRLV